MSEVLKAEVEKRADAILTLVSKPENKGRMPHASREEHRIGLVNDLPSHIQALTALRTSTDRNVALDISLAEFANMRFGFAMGEDCRPDAFLEALGLNPANTTIHSLLNTGDRPDSYKWLVPELIREAIRLGLDRPANYKSWIAGEESIAQPEQTMPSINESDAMPTLIAEGETIPTGNVSFNQKKVKTQKFGTGILVTDEVVAFTPLNLLSLFLGDVGRKLNLGLDNMAMNVLVNGDQTDGSLAAPVVGTQSGTAFAYLDLLRVWMRMGRLGRMPSGMIMNEGPALSILELPEFKGFAGETTKQGMKIQTPLPASQSLWVSGTIPDTDYIMFLDPTAALIKLNSMPLKVETERFVRNQTEGVYVSLMTGFANLFRDARVILQRDAAFSGQGFPAYMDVDAYEASNKLKGL